MAVVCSSSSSCMWPSAASLEFLSSSSSSPSPPTFRVSCFSPPLHKTIAQIKNSGVIACLRAKSAERALEAARAALGGGISVLEIVISTPGVFEVVRQLVQDHPTAVIGVGTVLDAKDANYAIDSGAKFLMSPAMVKDILCYVQDAEVLYIPGAMTPTEILSAYDAGSQIVKVYPISALGGVQYMSALNRPFAHIPMVASQGITIDSVAEYIGCGASSVVLSDAIFDNKAMDQGNFDAIYQVAHLAALLGSEAVERKSLIGKPPKSGWMKVNTEASLADDSAAIGGLFRDEFGTAHSAFSSHCLGAYGFMLYFTLRWGFFSPFPHGTTSLSVTQEDVLFRTEDTEKTSL